jgi:hypothetical protein
MTFYEFIMIGSQEKRGGMMPDCEVVPMSVKFFRNDRLLCMFDPETFKMYLYRDGRWIESEDPTIREDIRLRSVELSRREALGHACA